MKESAANGDVEANPGAKLLDYYDGEYRAREEVSLKKSRELVSSLTDGFKKGTVNSWSLDKIIQGDEIRSQEPRFDTAMEERGYRLHESIESIYLYY